MGRGERKQSGKRLPLTEAPKAEKGFPNGGGHCERVFTRARVTEQGPRQEEDKTTPFYGNSALTSRQLWLPGVKMPQEVGSARTVSPLKKKGPRRASALFLKWEMALAFQNRLAHPERTSSIPTDPLNLFQSDGHVRLWDRLNFIINQDGRALGNSI